MTSHHHARARRLPSGALIGAIALAAVGVAGPTRAQDTAEQKAKSEARRAVHDPARPVRDMDEGAVPAKPVISPPGAVDAPQDAVAAAPSPLPPASMPALSPDTTTGGEPAQRGIYGPPEPKMEKGKLPDISWTEPPAGVPPALDEAVNIVTRNYPSAKSARAALSAAASDVSAAKWLRFPRLSAGIETLTTDSRGRDRVAPEPTLDISLPIWSGGRIGAEIKRTKAAEDVSSATYVQTVQQLAQTTAQAYFEVARLAQREQLLGESLAEHRRLVGTMERRVVQEVSPQADLELAQSRSAQIEQEYTITRAQRRSTLRVLAELIADPAYDLGTIPPYAAEDLVDRPALEEQSVAFDPELRRLEGIVDVARADLSTKKASIFPQVDAQYSYNDVFGSRVGVVLRAQNTGGLSQFSEVNASRLRIQGALEDVRVAEQQLRREVANDIIEFDAARARAEISTSASATAGRVSESYMRQFIAGRRSWLDVMNALREAVNAQMGKVDAQTSAMSSRVRLLLRSGRWHPVFQQNSPSERLGR